jgi:helicase
VKSIIEEGFESQEARVLITTTTLAAGINLPVDRISIDEPWKGPPGEFGENLTPGEYKNLAGRATRPQYEEVSEY